MDGSLTSFIEEVTGESHLRVEDDLGDGFVRLRRAEAERRQAKHDIRCTEDIIIEVLRNSRDAGARNIFLALTREGDLRRICVVDDGSGIPRDMHEMIFEPRVTSKLETMNIDAWGVHGRGMALYSIASNTVAAHIVDSEPGKGTALLIECDLGSLPEKTDQSSMPVFVEDEHGKKVARGPRNIHRVVAEFALEHRDTCSVFCGSVTDIVATLYAYGQATLTQSARAFCNRTEDLPLAKRLCTAGDPAALCEVARSIGLLLSERSARRILDGQIAPLADVAELCDKAELAKGKARSKKPADVKKLLMKDARGLKISEDDMAGFKRAIHRAFEDLAEGYYLEKDVEVQVRVHSDGIHIGIPLSKLD